MLIQEEEPQATEPSSSSCLQCEEIVNTIFSFLDAKSLSLASAVCKHWYHFASDSQKFWKSAFRNDFKDEFDKLKQKDDTNFPWKLYYIKTAKLQAIGSELIFEEKECDQTKKENVSSIQPQKQAISNKMDTTSRVDVMDCNSMHTEDVNTVKMGTSNNVENGINVNGEKKKKQKKKRKKRKRETEDPMENYLGGDEWVVEKIIAKQRRFDKMHYLIQWKGFPHSENTWEIKENLSCPILLKRFMAKQKKLEQEKKRKPLTPLPTSRREQYLMGLEELGEDILISLKTFKKLDIVDDASNKFTLENLDSETLRALFIAHTHTIVNLYKKFKGEIHKYSKLPDEETLFGKNYVPQESSDSDGLDTSLGLNNAKFAVNVKKECIAELAIQLENMRYLDELMPPTNAPEERNESTEPNHNTESNQGNNSLKQKLDLLAEEKQKLHEFMLE